MKHIESAFHGIRSVFDRANHDHPPLVVESMDQLVEFVKRQGATLVKVSVVEQPQPKKQEPPSFHFSTVVEAVAPEKSRAVFNASKSTAEPEKDLFNRVTARDNALDAMFVAANDAYTSLNRLLEGVRLEYYQLGQWKSYADLLAKVDEIAEAQKGESQGRNADRSHRVKI